MSDRDIQIYKEYLDRRKNRETVAEIAARHAISRSAVYETVRRIRFGNTSKIRRGLSKAHFNYMWQFRYKPRFLGLPEDKEEAERELVEIIKGMRKDGFPITQIAAKLGKQRQYVYHRIYKHKI
jgi:predicted transcriptional regulator